jgi:serine/threonine protein kinase
MTKYGSHPQRLRSYRSIEILVADEVGELSKIEIEPPAPKAQDDLGLPERPSARRDEDAALPAEAARHGLLWRVRPELAADRSGAALLDELPAVLARIRKLLASEPQAAQAPELSEARRAQGEAVFLFCVPQGEALASALARGAHWSDREILRLGWQLASGLACLHAAQLCHGRLQPQGIWLPAGAISEQAPPLLPLLGMSRLYEHAAGPLRQSPQAQPYRAPELCEFPAAAATPAGDVFALGAVLQAVRACCALLAEGSAPEVPTWSAAGLAELLQHMMSAEPGRRPSMASVAAQLDVLLRSYSGYTFSARLDDELWVAECQASGRRGFLQVVSTQTHPRAAVALLRAGRALQRLALEGFCSVLDVGCLADGRAYTFCAPVFQETLAVRLRREGTLRRDALALTAQLAQALDGAHGKGLLYLGLCPERIALIGAAPRLLLLCSQTTSPSLLQDSTMDSVSFEAGEPLDAAQRVHAAPELLSGGAPPTRRSDVYALGSVLWQMLFGSPPREMSLASSPDPQPTPAPAASAPSFRLSHELETLLSSMLADEPAKRPLLVEVQQLLPWLVLLSELLNGPPVGGKYRVIRQLKPGGMGAVLEAINEASKGRVVLKIPFPQFPIERMQQEVQAAIRASTEHPGIVRIFDCVQLAGGTPCVVMEYLEGTLLSERIRSLSGRVPTQDVIRIGRQLASALSAAHRAGVVHRDLKPDNVMLVSDPDMPAGERVKVFDFGIAKVASDYERQERRRLTRWGTYLGTPGYSAPEQLADSASVCGKADVYSLGVILYEMLGGTLPLSLPLRRLGPPRLMQLVAQMIEVLPEKRPTMQQVVQQLTSSGPRLAWHRALAALLALVLILTAAAALRRCHRAAETAAAGAPGAQHTAGPGERPPTPPTPPTPPARPRPRAQSLPQAARVAAPAATPLPGAATTGAGAAPPNARPQPAAPQPGSDGTQRQAARSGCPAISARCVQGLDKNQLVRSVIADALSKDVTIRLCGRDAIVLSARSGHLVIQDAPPSVSKRDRTIANLSLQTLLDQRPVPAKVVIRCPTP